MSAWVVHFDAPLAYASGVRIQEQLLHARAANQIPDTVLFLEHQPVVTLGTRGRKDYLVATPENLAKRGIDLAHASRGGDVTFHGPGQLIMYPILKLGRHEADAHSYLHNLEEIAIRTAADFGVVAYRREGMNGAWTDAGKIAAIGFRLKRWVTMHGMSFNVDVNLDGFRTIVPCGLEGESVSSLKDILGDNCPSLEDARTAMSRHFEDVCGRRLTSFSVGDDLPEEIRGIVNREL